MNTKLTDKQIETLKVLIRGNGFNSAGTLIACDLDQLIERLSYAPSKQSIQFSIRALMKRGLVYRGEHENRRNRRRVLIVPTDLAKTIVTSKILGTVEEPVPTVGVSFPTGLTV